MIGSTFMNALDQELQKINASTVRMLSQVRESVNLAQRGLVEADVKSAQKCIDDDVHIDKIQEQLEQRILSVIARRQPAARDLRFLGAVHRALSDIERAGDYAVRVARASIALSEKPPLKKYLDMDRILTILSTMIEVTIKALTESDIEAARHAWVMDDEIDDLYGQMERELLTYMIEDANTISVASQLLSVGRSLERLGDHIENVNEHIIFWLTGERL
ncbi:MAG: phosphate transport system regulatory protein PhoU [Trueperaceae bacterium]|jgi:phosphate transport system protein|nr:phosphate transport system regulatory protein PhoU [Trueperaceae bacterium]|tara:strand:+ start:75 stop:731 length:657 start_codon:yes stop_codon:yes gene_type:complete